MPSGYLDLKKRSESDALDQQAASLESALRHLKGDSVKQTKRDIQALRAKAEHLRRTGK